jgi:osmoprotectant transport system permease protein
MDLAVGAVRWILDPVHWQGADSVPTRLGEHVAISVASVAVALLVAVPAGLWVGHTRRFALLAVNLANIGRATPSYAVMAMILPISLSISPELGLSLIPTFVAMTVLAIPPVLVNTYTGIRQVDEDLVEAGRGMGMLERQVLAGIELPLALPVIFGGIRTAAVQVVATATLGAIVGFGGLGRYLIDGIARRDFERLFAGVILVALLAILTELGLALVQRRLTSRGLAAGGPARAFTEPAETGQPGGASPIA